MAHSPSANKSDGEGKERQPPGFGGTIFLQQGAHVTVLDARGRIITVNDAWQNFGRENGLDPAYRFVGVSYPEICERAIEARGGNEGARDTLDGINKVLASEASRFSLVYPCHAPQKQRWFLMYARPIAPSSDGAVVSHVDVTALHVAGLVPDETARAPKPSPSSGAADKLAQLLFPDAADPLAVGAPRLR